MSALSDTPSVGSASIDEACRLSGIVKRYGRVTALSLDRISLKEGEVHALVGHNGAGKSTLVKVLAGVVRPDEGEIQISGEDVELSGASDAIDRGIAPVFQELLVIPRRSGWENANLGVKPPCLGPFIRWREVRRRTEAVARKVGLSAKELSRSADELGVAALQRVAVCRALQLEAKIFIFDEPTASLSETEVGQLFSVIEDLKDDGAAVLYISHRLEELPRIADRITVMRDGRRVDTVKPDISKRRIVELMTGHSDLETQVPGESMAIESAPVVLSAKGIGVRDGQSITFEARGGELLGIAGLVGAGRSSIGRALIGAQPLAQGEIEFEGTRLALRTPRDSALHGIGYIPDDRRRAGLVIDKGLAFNVALSPKSKFRRYGFMIDYPSERRATSKLLDQLGIRSSGLDQPVAELSGGNQQKVLLARSLMHKARALVIDEPTAGLDVEARTQVYAILREIASIGGAVIFISSDVDEVAEVCDRVIVMREFRLVAELYGPDITKGTILNYCYSQEGNLDNN